jgi:hypothetical protein
MQLNLMPLLILYFIAFTTVLLELFPSGIPPPLGSQVGTALLVCSKTRPISGSMFGKVPVRLPVGYSTRLRRHLKADTMKKH